MILNARWLTAGMSLVLALQGAAAFATDGEWPNWRGPNGDGHCTGTTVPVRWDGSSIVWRTELPGQGQSSPVISGDRVFLTSALESGRQRLVLCVNRQDGATLWKETVWTGEPEPSHPQNGWASATCATDGERVVAFFGRGGLHCFTVEGKKLWSKDLGKFAGAWGTGASPLILGDTVIQNCEAEDQASLTAFNTQTGDVAWQTPRDIPMRGGWSTPVLINAGVRHELVLNGFNGVPPDSRSAIKRQDLRPAGASPPTLRQWDAWLTARPDSTSPTRSGLHRPCVGGTATGSYGVSARDANRAVERSVIASTDTGSVGG